MTRRLEAVVIGTGFGGSVVACRTAQRWPGQVLVLERGRRYPRGSFARTPAQMKASFWNADGQRDGHDYKYPEQRGLFDVRSFSKMDVVMAAGLGGGSLIYANVMLEPPDAVFANERWPKSCDHATLRPYYDTVRTALAARPVPPPTTPERRIPHMELHQRAAVALGRTSRPLDIAVFFGPDHNSPTPFGDTATNRYGAEQTSCTYCGECVIGCNIHAKNTLDLNYLYAAEHHHGATIETDSLVEKIVPLNADGADDPAADGSNGYRVEYRPLDQKASISVRANRVIVSAGSLGSTELLLRCRDKFGTLPKISPTLGERFSGNGDFLSIAIGADELTRPEHGPVITQAIDFNLFENHDPKRAFVLEDAGFPNELSWYLEAAKPKLIKLRTAARTVVQTAKRAPKRRVKGRIGYRMRDLLGGTVSSRSAVLLCMGIDRAMGRMRLDRHGWIRISWPQRKDRALYKAIVDSADAFGKAVGAKFVISAPTWWLPVRRNVTVHALGGCVLGPTATQGVVNDDPSHFGEVFGYRNLYVADGSIIPIAVGSNPSLTIAALAERVAEAITGISPDHSLGVEAQ